MKKLILNFILLIVILFLISIFVLSTIGIETNKFNKLISDKTSNSKNINLNLNSIRFKVNLKEISLFLETFNPEIAYRGVSIPAQNIKVYIDFISLLKSDLKIKRISLILNELDVAQLNKLSKILKPSNFKSLLNNKVKEGKLVSEIEIFLTESGELENFIAKGSVKGLRASLLNQLSLTKLNFSFFADKNDILIKNIFGNLDKIELSDGDIKLNLDNGVKLNSNFNSKLDLEEKFLRKYISFLNKLKITKNIKYLKADLNNNISIELDNTYKVKDYNYRISGNIGKTQLELINPINNSFITSEIKEIYLSNLDTKIILNPKNTKFNVSGKYSFNNLDFFKLNLDNNLENDVENISLNFDYGNDLKLDFINYNKPNKSIANLSLALEKKKNQLRISELNFKEKKI